MLGSARTWFVALTIAAVSALLVSCGSMGEHSAVSEPSESIGNAHQIPSSQARDLSAQSSLDANAQSESSAATSGGDSGVGVSNAATPEPSTTADGKAVQEAPFDSGHPMLNGIGFQDNIESIEQRFGLSESKYELPGDHATIDMREYPGFTVGFGGDGDVIYVELTSSEAPTGITGLKLGMPGQQAAELLEILDHPGSHVLTMDLSEGWLKLDLDPDTHDVLSIKLIGSE
ncbi:hypothetical protein [Cohnella panacarvi]|uniref:hypothetical protein n=1 Tax=Cohnella panacarvi TaxID=400776 RepID=UPI00047B3B6D|nr:hypothetical protein [Cohnella panacarvi]